MGILLFPPQPFLKVLLSDYSHWEEHNLAKSKVFEAVKTVTNTMSKND